MEVVSRRHLASYWEMGHSSGFLFRRRGIISVRLRFTLRGAAACASIVGTSTGSLSAAEMAPTAQAFVQLTANVARIDATEAPTIDGDLSDPAWAKATIIDDLKQRQPDPGAPPTERTVLRIMYDENNLYFGIYAYDSEPDRIVVRAMARDGALNSGDNINLIIDPTLSRRNSYVFQVGASGGRLDALRLNNSEEITQWNTIWDAKVRRVADGWVTEVAIPFRSISYIPGQSEWGFVFARNIRRKPENDRWSETNPALTFTAVASQAQEGGGTISGRARFKLVGVDPPGGNRGYRVDNRYIALRSRAGEFA